MPSDWRIGKCLALSIAVPIALLGLIGLAGLGFDAIGLRQIIGFVFLAFIPGCLILRILRVHSIGPLEKLVYSVGLSLSFVMFSGLFANWVLPYLGVSEPISVYPVIGILTVFTIMLCGIAYKRDRKWEQSSSTANDFDLGRILSLPYLIVVLLPIGAVSGALLMNYQRNNIILLFFVIIVASIVGLVAFDRLPKKALALAIAMIALGLLFHTSLISTQLSGWDIHKEYYFQNLVAQNGHWDETVPHNYNTALSIVMLAPMLSLILDMDAIWIFKIVYPLVFSLVPLALFLVYREQIGTKKAFLSAFFFMALVTFFTEMTALARQQIAELFFALLILLMVDRRLALNQRATLFIIFAVSLAVSHYAIGYIYLAFLVGGWVIVALIRSRARVVWEWLTGRFGGLPQGIVSDRAFPMKIMMGIIGIYLVFALGWYGGIAQGTALDSIQDIGRSQISLPATEPFQPARAEAATLPTLTEPAPISAPSESAERESEAVTALGLDFWSASALGKAFRVLLYVTELLVVVGFIRLILKPARFKAEYIALTVIAALILLAVIVLPGFSAHLRVTRLYHISLFLLAPCCILGSEAVWHGLSRLFNLASHRIRGKLALAARAKGNDSAYSRFLALAILIPYFLFNAGFFFEVTRSERMRVDELPASIALSSHRVDIGVFGQKDAEAAIHLSEIMDDSDLVYADKYGSLLLQERLFGQVAKLPRSGKVYGHAYVFLRTWNVDKQEMVIMMAHGVQIESVYVSLSDMPTLLEDRKIIFDNGGAQIWGAEIRPSLGSVRP